MLPLHVHNIREVFLFAMLAIFRYDAAPIDAEMYARHTGFALLLSTVTLY